MEDELAVRLEIFGDDLDVILIVLEEEESCINYAVNNNNNNNNNKFYAQKQNEAHHTFHSLIKWEQNYLLFVFINNAINICFQ